MLKALAWKEWREQRPVMLAGLALSTVLPFFLLVVVSVETNEGTTLELSRQLLVGFGLFVWPVLAAAAGAATISTELGDGTFAFLLSRPLTRTRLWVIKVLVAGAAALSVVLWSLVVVQACNWWAHGETTGASLGALLRGIGVGPFDALALVSLSFLLFASSVLFSTFLTRPLTAAAAGLAFSLILLAGIFVLWARFLLVPRLEPQWLALELLLTGFLVLFISFAFFARGEILPHASTWRWPAIAAVLLTGVLGLGALPSAPAAARLSADEAVIRGDHIAVSDYGVVLEVADGDGASYGIWLVNADGSGTLPLTGRRTVRPLVTPSWRTILYYSKRGLGGAVLDSYDLRGIDLDGSGDRLIAPGLLAPEELFFSPNGRWAALVTGTELSLISLDGARVVSADLSGTPVEGASLKGWIDSYDDELLFVGSEPAAVEGIEELTLMAYGVESGVSRTIASSRVVATDDFREAAIPRGGWRRFPLPVALGAGPEGGARVELMDLVDASAGDRAVLGDTHCFSTSPTFGSTVLAYTLCDDPSEPGSMARVLLRRFLRGRQFEERVVSELDLSRGMVHIVDALFFGWDRDAAVVLLERRPSSGGSGGALVVSRAGMRRGMPPGWLPVGLVGGSRVLLVDSRERVRTIASGDINTGALQVIYP